MPVSPVPSPPPFTDLDAFLRRIPDQRPLMGLDLGARTIGVAMSNSRQDLALAVETIRRKRQASDITRLRELARSRDAAGVVIGLPVRLDGRSGSSAQGIRRRAETLANELALPVLLWDERLSTAAVERAMIEADTSRARRKKGVDAEAAAWILQGALNAFGQCRAEAP